jgi:hypothetical protein
VDANTVGYLCVEPYRVLQKIETFRCPPNSECIGPGLDRANDPDVKSRCIPKPNRIATWRTKLKNALTIQCRCFTFTSANLGIVSGDDNLGMVLDDASLGTLNVQVVHSSSVTYPPMPGQALLSYQGATYPIQSIMPQQMEMQYGSFDFGAVFDPTQPLEFCVYVSTQIEFVWAFIPYNSNSQGVRYKRENITEGDSHRRGNMTSNKANSDELTYNGVTYDVASNNC